MEMVSAERTTGRWVIADTGREVLVHVMEVVCGEAELPEVVGALDPVRRLPDALYRRHQQADEDGDDRDHHQQLDQREPAPRVSS